MITLVRMDALTIQAAAEMSGWSARMLRYIEHIGLVVPARSSSRYRIYGPAELQRLRTLRELLTRFDVGLAEMGFARRMADDADLRRAVEGWLRAQPARPAHVAAADWLRWGAGETPTAARPRGTNMSPTSCSQALHGRDARRLDEHHHSPVAPGMAPTTPTPETR